MAADAERISIIIPTLNEAAGIRDTLARLLTPSPPPLRPAGDAS